MNQIQFLEKVSNPALAQAVIEQMGNGGWEEFSVNAGHIAWFGAHEGVNGFLSPDQTINFSLKNYDLIDECLKQEAENNSQNIMEILIKRHALKDIDPQLISEVLESKNPALANYEQVFLELGWYAVEKMAAEYDELQSE